MARKQGKRVAVIGGGVGGLSAAHELIQRGFSVHVYESERQYGGKAASQDAVGPRKAPRRALPGEHGFRFYPAFYTHLIETMSEIPTAEGVVSDRLIASDEAGVAAIDDETLIRMSRQPVQSPGELFGALQAFFGSVNPTAEDLARFNARTLAYLTTCSERRRQELEYRSWWDFVEGDQFSPSFQRYIRAVPRTMVAMDATVGSAWTIGEISMQLLLDFGDRAAQNDRTLDGPTTERWINPWISSLRAWGVRFHPGQDVVGVDLDGGRVRRAWRADGSAIEADWFVLAVPIEQLVGLVSPELAEADPQMARLRGLDTGSLTAWMSGAQFFLREAVPMLRGHVFYPDSDWALTSISQAQFWASRGRPVERHYGDGSVKGVLSIDISDWFTPSRYTGLSASQTPSADAVLDEIWRQVKAGVNAPRQVLLRDEDVVARHLDTNIRFPAGGGAPVNLSPLLVHPPGAWDLRPEAASAVENLFFASDFVRTYTNLATMEGANEAARRATNAILERSGVSARPSRLTPLQEPAIFAPARALDAQRFANGEPHVLDAVDRGLDSWTDRLLGLLEMG
jgi:uncharacterized protein with NAD-binding domain and iron-sulfur cluster